jgi:tetratricopeptide (TPR) repeat protein
MKVLVKLLVFLFSLGIYSQSNEYIKQQEFLILQKKVRSFFNSNRDSSYYYIAKIEKSTNKVHLAFAKGAKSFLYALDGKVDDALKIYEEGLALINQVGDSQFRTENESFIYNYGGNIYYARGEFSKALECYVKAKNLSYRTNDIVKINMININIANINSDIGNYNKAISIYKESDELLNSNKPIYSQEEYAKIKSDNYYNLGICYEEYYTRNRQKIKLLDSAFHYYEKAFLYSDNNLNIKLLSLKNIGNIYYYKGDLNKAEERYLVTYSLAKENKDLMVLYSSSYNLGLINYDRKKYDVALVFFKSIDSLYKVQPSLGDLEFIHSNYKQAQIYDGFDDPQNALKHSNIFNENYDKMNAIQNKNVLEANGKLNKISINQEVKLLKEKSEFRILLKKIFYVFFVVILVLLVILIINKIKNKKTFDARIEAIIKEYQKAEQMSGNQVNNKVAKQEVLSISSDNEKEIVENLAILIEKKMYLKSDFTQQMVAKKIKTNTTYLSSVVNKRYKKSFSNYLNELRINYVINEIMINARYREYTTQAIAESAGFKNADSFTTSFKKKTGVTPFQFINEIKKRETVNRL